MLGALRSALSAKVRDGELKVVQAFTLADHKTKNAMNALANVATGRTVLVVDNGENRNLELGVAQSEGRHPDAHPRRSIPITCWATRTCCSREAAARKFSEALAK